MTRRLVLVVLTGVVACPEPPNDGGLNQPCRSNRDCEITADLRCINDRCRPEQPELEIAFEVLPPPGLPLETAVVRQQFPSAGDVSRREHILRLTSATSLSLIADQQIDVDIFRVGSALPGRSFVDSRRVFPTGAGGAELSVVRLLPGRYDFFIQPASGLPPTQRRGEQIGSDTTSLELDPSGFLRLEGLVVKSTQRDVPLSGVRVVAYGVSSGRASPARITDEGGFFSLRLPQLEDERFEIVATSSLAAQPAWSYREEVEAPQEDVSGFVVPLELPAEEERRCVQVCVIGGAARVPRATVVLEAIDTREDTIAFEIAGSGRADGCLEVARFSPGPEGDGLLVRTASVGLMSGSYRVHVRPPVVGQRGDPPVDLSAYRGLNPSDPTPDGLPYATTETTLAVPRTDGPLEPGRDPCGTDPIETLQVEVGLRKLVIGRVVAESRPLRSPPFVSFHPLDRDDLPAFSTRPEPTGSFAVFLEPGVEEPARYLWVVEPTGADRSVHPVAFGEIAIAPTEGLSRLTQRLTRPLLVPDGISIAGQVLLPDGEGTPADVRAFSMVPSLQPARPGLQRSVLIGATRADDDGSFVMRLPTRQSPSP